MEFVVNTVAVDLDLVTSMFSDLNNNVLTSLGGEALSDMPNLITLRLHSQQPGLTDIQFNAFINIHQSLRYL